MWAQLLLLCCPRGSVYRFLWSGRGNARKLGEQDRAEPQIRYAKLFSAPFYFRTLFRNAQAEVHFDRILVSVSAYWMTYKTAAIEEAEAVKALAWGALWSECRRRQASTASNYESLWCFRVQWRPWVCQTMKTGRASTESDACGLQLRMHAVFSYGCMRPWATDACMRVS